MASSCDYTSLMRAVGGHYLGFGTSLNPDDYTPEQKYQADEVAIQGGLRKFYSPEPLGKMPPVQWSFLRPTASLNLVASVGDYSLPEEFGGLIGTVTVLTTNGVYGSLRTVNEGIIRALRSTNQNVTGIPKQVAVRAKPMSPGFPQGWELLVFPMPQTTYTIQFKMLVNWRRLSKENPYPYGGEQHSQTILCACLSEAEQKVQDIPAGPQQAEYLKRLAASIAVDAQAGRGEHLGYSGDPSTPECYRLRGGGRGFIWTDSTYGTYEGVRY